MSTRTYRITRRYGRGWACKYLVEMWLDNRWVDVPLSSARAATYWGARFIVWNTKRWYAKRDRHIDQVVWTSYDQ